MSDFEKTPWRMNARAMSVHTSFAHYTSYRCLTGMRLVQHRRSLRVNVGTEAPSARRVGT